jgi:hypothetical protein
MGQREHPSAAADPGTATYDLAEVQRVARLAIVHRARASRIIVERLGVSEPEAERRAREKLGALKAKSFVRTDIQEYDPPIAADIYGVCDEDGNWFIKFYMEHGRVTIVSCHGPARDLTCVDGTVIKEQQP